MPSKNTFSSQRILRRLAANWQRIRPFAGNLPPELDRDDIFICPTCQRIFPREMWTKDYLSLEHVPPEGVGGKGITITCRGCNNISGSKIDAQLVREQKYLDFLAGLKGTSWRGTYSVNNSLHKLQCEFTHVDKGAWSIVGIPERTNPIYLNHAIHEIGDSDSNDLKVNVHFSGHIPKLADLALVRAAFLWGFAILGYPFLFNRHLEIVRQQIIDPQKSLFPRNGVLKDDFTHLPVGLHLINAPLELRCYLVVLDLKSEYGSVRRRGVILPAPIEAGDGIYERWDNRANYGKTIQFTTVTEDYDMN